MTDPRPYIGLFLLLAGGAFADQVVINDAIDQLLDSVRLALKNRGSNIINIKDIDKTFNTKIFGLVVPGHFKASGGHAEDLASLHRTADAVLTTEGNTLKLSFGMGFAKLDMGFSSYDFEYLSVKSSGSMDVVTNGSALHAAVSVNRDGDKCIASLDALGVDSLGNLKIQMSGKAVLNQLISMLSSWIMDNFQDNISKVINLKLVQAAEKGLTKVDLCKSLPH